MSHSAPFVSTLLDVAHGPGGRKVLVEGQYETGVRYWAGWQFKPVATLFEAVLRCVMAGKYDRIVAFTGQAVQGLPSWRLAGELMGAQPLAWVVDGETNGHARSAAAGAAPARPWEISTIQIRPAPEVLWRGMNRSYWDRLEQLIELRRNEIASAVRDGKRLALLIDYGYLAPTGHELDHFIGNAQLGILQPAVVRISSEFNISESQLGPADQIVFSEDATSELMLDDRGNFLDQYCHRKLQNAWNPTRFDGNIPLLTLGSETVRVAAERPKSPLLSFIEPDATTLRRRDADLYSLLTGAKMNTNPPPPPIKPENVALEFWASLDLRPLEEAFAREIVGQENVCRGVLDTLRRYSDLCRKLLLRNPGAAMTYRDVDFLPPTFGFFGAAGMGKTTFAEIIGNYLFSERNRFRRITLTEIALPAAIAGVSPPFEGNQNLSELMEFARDTQSLGIVCFDEFTRILLPNGQSLANGLSPFLPLVESRFIEPANSALRPRGGRFYMTNTVFVFAANIGRPDEDPAASYVPLDTLGDPFQRRVVTVDTTFFFEFVQPENYARAFAAVARRRMALREGKLYPELVDMMRSAELTPALILALVDRLKEHMNRTRAKASLDLMDKMVRTLDFEGAIEAARTSGASHIVAGIEAMGGSR